MKIQNCWQWLTFDWDHLEIYSKKWSDFLNYLKWELSHGARWVIADSPSQWKQDCHFVKKTFTWKQWHRTYGNEYITTPDIDYFGSYWSIRRMPERPLIMELQSLELWLVKVCSCDNFRFRLESATHFRYIIFIFGSSQPPTFGTQQFANF